MTIIVFFCAWTSYPQNFVNLLLFSANFSLFVLEKLLLMKKRIISSVIIAVHGFLKAISVVGGWVSKMAIEQIKQLLSIAQAQIVPMLKQLRLKLTSKQTSFAVDEYYSDRPELKLMQKRKTVWELIDQVAKIIKQLDT